MSKRARCEDRTVEPGSNRLSPLASFLLKKAARGYNVISTKGSLLEDFMRDAPKDEDEKPEGWHTLRSVVTVKMNQYDRVYAEFDQDKFRALVDRKDHSQLCEVLLYLEECEVELWEALDSTDYPCDDSVPLAECILDEARALWSAL